MDEISFYIKPEDLEETKRAVRSLDSLRFTHNPMSIGKEVNISLLGSREDLNKLTEYLSDKCRATHRKYN